MSRKYNCPVSDIGLPWIYDLSPGAKATREPESGAAAFGCPGRRSGCLVSASRPSPAATQEKAPPGVLFTSGRIDRPESFSYRLDNSHFPSVSIMKRQAEANDAEARQRGGS